MLSSGTKHIDTLIYINVYTEEILLLRARLKTVNKKKNVKFVLLYLLLIYKSVIINLIIQYLTEFSQM